MELFSTILISLLVFGFLIFIHEFGHFITARIFKVTVKEFSIGMGPKLMWYDSKKSGTRYSLAMFPIGGFVAMAGEDEESDDPNSFDKKPAWQRFIITAAGAFVNVVFGFIAMFIIVGMIERIGGTTVAEFQEDSVMSEAYADIDISVRSSQWLQVDDVITHIEGTRVVIPDELSYEIMRHGNEPVDVTVIRNGETVVLHDVVFPRASEQGQVFGLMDFKVRQIDKDFGNFMTLSFRKTALVFRMCWESIFDLITGRYTVAAISGPIGISSAIGNAVSSGFITVLNLVVIISINLGFMNLLPIPALDGGRMLVLFVEMVSRKKLPQKVEMTINAVGLAVLLGLSLIIMVKDVFTLF